MQPKVKVESNSPEILLVTDKGQNSESLSFEPCPPDCAPNNEVNCTPNDCGIFYQ